MSGLLALLDDVATIAKVAAASLDDVVGQATKAGVKAAGAVIDDAAVTPKYVHGFSADRELPIVGRIALGSIRNKLLILLPAALVLSAVLPQAIPPLLMLGGAYLCFEGAEKLWHLIAPHGPAVAEMDEVARDAAHLEEAKVAGAIKTDFILSAEIMTIALAALPDRGIVFSAVALALVGVAITAIVYGGVALIVKADDAGLHLATRGRLAVTRALGRAVVRGMPGFLKALSAVGTAAMLWVGGSIVLHGLEQIGFAAPAHLVHDAAVALGAGSAVIEWAVTAALGGLAGVVLGFALIPLGTRVVAPLWAAVTGAR
jgi:predicted DNA repair protein MutK